ncbi:MAG TPA: hypothetical protein P5081_10575 [Phycisphaerae bacterium]|nr:hypothetical protein [Phycisphaerae bacterium]HRW53322.1 hypothetical protein [Phycisphaerae bacterium]
MSNFAALLTGAILLLAGAAALTPPARVPPTTQPAEAAAPQVEFAAFPFSVAVPADASTELKACARRLARAMGRESVLELSDNRNPVCCFWIELTNWWPNPGRGGYVIIIQHGGAILYAATIEDANRGVARIERVRRKRGESWTLPIGLMTDYPIWAEGATPIVDKAGGGAKNPSARQGRSE